MINFKSICLSVCLSLTMFTVWGKDPKITLLFKGKPLCYWTVTLRLGNDVYGEAVTNDRGVVEFRGVSMPSKDFDLSGIKTTANGEKKWKVTGMFRFHDDSYTATIKFEEVIAQLVSFMGGSESNYVSSWGLDGECTEPSNSNSASNENSNSNSNSSSHSDSNGGSKSIDNSSSNNKSNSSSNNSTFKKDEGKSVSEMNEENMRKNQENMERMRIEREKRDAEHKAALPQKKAGLEEKIERLNQKIERTKNELTSLTPGTTEQNNKSYDLRELEIERELTELELDKTIDEIAAGGYLKKSDRQRYSEKTEALEDEQKQLLKNKKNGKPYAQNAQVSVNENNDSDKKSNDKEEEEEKIDKEDKKEKAEKKEKEEEIAAEDKQKEKNKEKEIKEEKKKDEPDEDDAPFKIYSSEELANLSSFDLKRTRLSNKNSINKREVKLKVKSSFYSQDKIAKLKGEIESLHKQVDAINAILAQRNEKVDETEEPKKD